MKNIIYWLLMGIGLLTFVVDSSVVSVLLPITLTLVGLYVIYAVIEYFKD